MHSDIPFDRPALPRFLNQVEREPSLRAAFSGNVMERNSEHRGEEDVRRALARPDARIMLVAAGSVCMRPSPAGRSIDFPVGEARDLKALLEEAILLGNEDGAPVLIAPLDLLPQALPARVEAVDPRSIYAGGLLAPARLGALAQGMSLLHWNQTHRFCGRCGGASRMLDGGYRRSCTVCSADHFPRTDPVVIMMVLDGEHCLLGRSYRFKPGMYSCLAGFLEPGETIEAAVRRETREESGIHVGRVAYHASQPWPFPHTLMIGCYAEALTRELTVDHSELEDCRWFSRTEIRAILAGTEPQIAFPPAGAIASLLIRDWADGAI